jgi:hypothetical protein
MSNRQTAPHGSRSRYVAERCRCAACRQANAAYETTRHRRASHRVPADAARAHLRALHEEGLSIRDLALATGTSRGTVERVMTGSAVTIRSATEASILATSRPTRERVPAHRALEILDALDAAGYPHGWVKAACGHDTRVRGNSVCRHRFDALASLARRLGAELAADGRVMEPPLPATLRRRLDGILSPVN